MIKSLVIISIYFLTVSIVQAKVVFDGGFETGDHSQWSELSWNLDRPKSEQFEIITDIVRRGTYSAKMTVHDGDEFLDTGGERVQLERPNAHNEHEGDEYWYQWSTYFPNDWQNLTSAPDNDWLLIADWHASNNADFGEVCQPLQIEVNGNNKLIARMLSGNVTGYDCFNGSGTANYYDQVIVNDIDFGKWNDFVIHVKWTVENTGLVEIWHKTDDKTSFKKVFNQTNIPTLQYINNKNNTDVPYFILAHYRSLEQSHTSVLYQDAFKQTTFPYDLDEYNGILGNIRSDVDKNGIVDSIDSLLILQNFIGFDMSRTNWQVSAITGDVNCDGNSNQIDAMLTLRRSLGFDMNETGWCGN